MKAIDKEYLYNKLKTSSEMMNRAKNTLMSHYTNGTFSEFVFFDHGKGSKVYDVDGNEFIDYTMGLGPLILGHAHPVITEAAIEAARKGTVHGIGNPYEIAFAELMVDAIPGAELVTFTNSGTEATMQAIKCARAFTGKVKIAKFEAHYHGTHDYAQISSRNSTEGPVEDPKSVPEFAGIPKSVVESVITLSMNRKESFEKIERYKDELACVILEPVPLTCTIDMRDFIKELRDLTQKLGILLIFDEVVTGFRLCYGGATEYFGIIPDLATYGKVIGGGFPVGAVAGRKEIMETFCFNIKELGRNKVFTTGTFNGNPVTCAAGAATLSYLRDNKHLYEKMDKVTRYLRENLEKAAGEEGYTFKTLGLGSFFVSYFHKGEVNQPRDIRWVSTMQSFVVLRRHMLKNGIVLSDTGSNFVSTEHTYEDCDKTVEIFKETIKEIL